MAEKFKVGEAPWEVSETNISPNTFKVGSAPWESSQPPSASQDSTAEAALEGFGQGASFGYLPQAQAATEVALDKVLPERLGGGRGITYQKAKDAYAKRSDVLAEENPLAYGAGAIGGGLAVPLGAAKATTGAAMGFAVNPGDEANRSMTFDPRTWQLEERLKNAAIGGTLGAASQGVSRAFAKSGAALSKARQELALKLAGARKAHFANVNKNKVGPKIVQLMEDNGMLKPGQTFETVLDKSTEIANDSGQKIGKIYDSVSEDVVKAADKSPEAAKELLKTRLNARKMTAEVLRNAKSELKGKAGGREALASLRKELENLKDLDSTKVTQTFEAVGVPYSPQVSGLPVPVSRVPGVPGEIPPMSLPDIDMSKSTRVVKETPFKKLLEYRQSLDDTLNYQKKFGESKGNEKALKIARDTIDKALDKRIETIDKFVGKSRLGGLNAAQTEYKAAKTLQNIAADKAAGEAAKANIGLLETIAGTGYAGAQIAQGQDPMKAIGTGLVGGLALRQARKYGPGLGYQTVKGFEKMARPLSTMTRVPTQGVLNPWILMSEDRSQ